MALRVLVLTCSLVGGLVLGRAPAARAQTADPPRASTPTPMGTTKWIPAREGRVASLRQLVALDLADASLKTALETIRRAANLDIVLGDDVLGAKARVTLHAEGITVLDALTRVLDGTGLQAFVSLQGDVVLVRRAATPRAAPGAITGRVTDGKTGDALGSAEVSLDGARPRVSTNEQGYFRLAEVEAGAYTLLVRRIGYERQSRGVTVESGREVTVDVALQPVVTQLTELVTTVTGEQRRFELGHVVGVINADSLVREAPVANIGELLSGRVPGLQVFTTSGNVGGEVRLQSRGPNSLFLTRAPIVIVDGVRYSSTAAPSLGYPFDVGPSVVEPTSPLNDLNPNDIESIEVVKGPSAATLYGTDAANGVIVISTKRGQPGPARWNAYVKGGITEVPTAHFGDMYWGWNTSFGSSSDVVSCSLNYVAHGYCGQDSVTNLGNPLNSPELSIFGHQPRWESGLNVSGGRQDLRYNFSADWDRESGPIQMPPALAEALKATQGLDHLRDEQDDPNALRQANLRANVTANLGHQADLTITSGYIHSATRTIAMGSSYSRAGQGNPAHPYGTNFDPSEVFSQSSTEHTDRFVGGVAGHWRPLAWLQTHASVGLDLAMRNRTSLSPRGAAPNDPYGLSTGAAQDDRLRQLAATGELGLTAIARRGRVSFRTSIGAQYVRTLNDELSSLGTDLPPGGSSVGEAANTITAQNYQETATLGSYAEETVGINERLFLTGAVRVDGASTFGQNYDAAAYPKVGASWLVSHEPFFPSIPGLDELRLRYAFGASGQQPRPEWSRPGFATTAVAGDDDQLVTVLAVSTLGNPDLRPERVREHEIGFDAEGWQGRLNLSLTWYKRRTVDELVPFLLPPGFGSVFTNLGVTTQHGFEAQLTTRLLDTRALSWDVSLLHALHRTKLVDLGGASPSYYFGGGYVEGYPLGARFMPRIESFADANGDGIIDSDEIQLSDAPEYAGESEPPISQTLTTSVGLFSRRVRISAMLERRSGFTQDNRLRQGQCGDAKCQDAVDPATPFDRQAQAVAVANFGITYLEPGDFTRFREMTVAADLPAGFVRALRVRSATLAVTARNVALWTDYSGPDPESASGGSSFTVPQGRSWSFRLDLGF